MEAEVLETEDIQELEDNQLICLISGEIKKSSEKELNLQSVIRMLNEEYAFEISDMDRDFNVKGQTEEGKAWKQKTDLVIFEKNSSHEQENIIRVCVIHDSKVKESDKKKGLEATLEYLMIVMDKCEFGLWTNGVTYHFLQKETDVYDNEIFSDLADFPAEGQTLADLDHSDRDIGRVPANDSLIKVFKRCHDYIYGNEGMKKTAFWELLNLIFCKIYDEKRRFVSDEKGETYRRKFWVGVKEQNSDEGRSKIAKRIKGLFQELKDSPIFKDVFDGSEQINLTDKGLSYISGELAKYSFLDASVDVKGTAYETIVSNTLKQEAGQFFTPRNVIKLMVEMLDPNEKQRVLDPACGSGGFLVMVLDYVRKQITQELYPSLSGVLLKDKYNSYEVNERVKGYAEQYLFGFDFDPDLKKAARMNMVMAGDGHANIFHLNSLAYPNGDNTQEIKKVKDSITKSVSKSDDKKFSFEFDHALGKFDLIFTNPPFGSKIPIDDPSILKNFELGHKWKKNEYGQREKKELSKSEPPEILFIENCYRYLKPSGKMAIVLPDGILGNPNTEYVRAWILDKFKILASIDLPVETFLPQVGVQASLLFLQRKTEEERQISISQEEDYEVFMAIAEKIGKDRRGNQIYERDEDGAEILFDEEIEYLITDKAGKKTSKVRKEKNKRLDDDLPQIGLAYKEFLSEINQ